MAIWLDRCYDLFSIGVLEVWHICGFSLDGNVLFPTVLHDGDDSSASAPPVPPPPDRRTSSHLR